MTTIHDIATIDDIKNELGGLRRYIRKCQADTIKWMLFFAITQPIALYLILSFLLRK